MLTTLKSAEIMLSMLKIKEFNVDGIISTDLMLSALNSLIFNIDSIIFADFNIVDIEICRNDAIDIKFAEIMPSTLNSLIFNINGIFSVDLTLSALFLWILMSQMLKSAKIILSMLKSKNLMPIILNSQK